MKQYYKLIDEQMVFFHEPLLSNDMQIFNPTEEQILNEGWIEYVIPEPEPEPIPDPTPEELLQQAKNAKITEIDAYNDSSNVNHHSGRGPCFGNYNDIQVFADYSNSNCVSVFPCNYKDNSGKGKSIFTGDFNNDNSNFRMKDIEVFKVS